MRPDLGSTDAAPTCRSGSGFGVSGPLFEMSKRQNKGHASEIDAWLRAVKQGGPAPIPLDELLEVARWSLDAGRAARSGRHPAASVSEREG